MRSDQFRGDPHSADARGANQEFGAGFLQFAHGMRGIVLGGEFQVRIQLTGFEYQVNVILIGLQAGD